MTYCVGIRTQQVLVMASDSRTNSGIDQVEICRKMHNFVMPGERMFTILSSGSLSLNIELFLGIVGAEVETKVLELFFGIERITERYILLLMLHHQRV